MSFTHVATTYLGPGKCQSSTVSRTIYECDHCEALVERKQMDKHRCPKSDMARFTETMVYMEELSKPINDYLPAEAFGNNLLKMNDAPPNRPPAQQIRITSVPHMTRDELVRKIKREMRTGS